jgi:hypothetical protein
MFYKGKLISDKSRIREDNTSSIRWIDIKSYEDKLDNQVKLNFYEIHKFTNDTFIQYSYYNSDEVDVVCALCDLHHDKNILVLTTYNAQLYVLKGFIKQSNVDIRSVDSAQGMEADIVILSLIRSNSNNDIGFVKNPNRMCVMLSRAKNKLYILGNERVYSNDANKLWKKCMNLIKKSQIITIKQVSDDDKIDMISHTNEIEEMIDDNNKIDPMKDINEIDPVKDINEIDPMKDINEIDPMKDINEIDPTKDINEIDPVKNIYDLHWPKLTVVSKTKHTEDKKLKVNITQTNEKINTISWKKFSLI